MRREPRRHLRKPFELVLVQIRLTPMLTLLMELGNGVSTVEVYTDAVLFGVIERRPPGRRWRLSSRSGCTMRG